MVYLGAVGATTEDPWALHLQLDFVFKMRNNWYVESLMFIVILHVHPYLCNCITETPYVFWIKTKQCHVFYIAKNKKAGFNVFLVQNKTIKTFFLQPGYETAARQHSAIRVRHDDSFRSGYTFQHRGTLDILYVSTRSRVCGLWGVTVRTDRNLLYNSYIAWFLPTIKGTCWQMTT